MYFQLRVRMDTGLARLGEMTEISSQMGSQSSGTENKDNKIKINRSTYTQKVSKSSTKCTLFNYNKKYYEDVNLHNLRRDIRWDKNRHMNTEIIHPTQVSFSPNWVHMNKICEVWFGIVLKYGKYYLFHTPEKCYSVRTEIGEKVIARLGYIFRNF